LAGMMASGTIPMRARSSIRRGDALASMSFIGWI
jgi:hypothetical protein